MVTSSWRVTKSTESGCFVFIYKRDSHPEDVCHCLQLVFLGFWTSRNDDFHRRSAKSIGCLPWASVACHEPSSLSQWCVPSSICCSKGFVALSCRQSKWPSRSFFSERPNDRAAERLWYSRFQMALRAMASAVGQTSEVAFLVVYCRLLGCLDGTWM